MAEGYGHFMKKKELEEILQDAEMLLVGIGEEFGRADELRSNEAYAEMCRQAANEDAQWAVPYFNRRFLKKDEQLMEAYRKLGELLQGKNYFVITTCMDGLIETAGLRNDRVTTPCGSYNRLQCGRGCAGSVIPTDHDFTEILETIIKGGKEWNAIDRPCCRICGAPMEYNTLYAEHYMEEGYEKSWHTYMKWLQSTLNRRLCILELGADMMFAGVLRFRFEKMISLNQKAKLLRVHGRLHQLPAEIAERGMGISQNAVDFMAKM